MGRKQFVQSLVKSDKKKNNRGRKTKDDNGVDKKKLQNRDNQRNWRNKQKILMETLKQTLEQCEHDLELMIEENQDCRNFIERLREESSQEMRRNQDLKEENEELKEKLKNYEIEIIEFEKERKELDRERDEFEERKIKEMSKDIENIKENEEIEKEINIEEKEMEYIESENIIIDNTFENQLFINNFNIDNFVGSDFIESEYLINNFNEYTCFDNSFFSNDNDIISQYIDL
ncbi:504_t:CDS:1 [Scutellospora calospora]|uniref:504_t:CDS:1 n=1 Tax=Scutellospora calospora TaxID=85575 RepID=A0ACA9KGL1_9GLOM|nr:504_t:CDS:1 [Scutellospora calospora]